MAGEEHELALRNVEGDVLQCGSGPGIGLADVEEFDHETKGDRDLGSPGDSKLSMPSRGVKTVPHEGGCQAYGLPG